MAEDFEERVIAERSYRDEDGELTVQLMHPYQDGADWFCAVRVVENAMEPRVLPIGGVDSLQAIRLALDIVDALVAQRPDAQSQGIKGIF